MQHRFTAAYPQQGEHAQHGQADVGQEVSGKARQPLLAGLHAQIGRENHIARAEKHGKQREAHHDHVAERAAFLLHTHYRTPQILNISIKLPCQVMQGVN